ncbi:HVO_0476 family zinc finger protein [Halosegnis marinus]|uniref:HVO_0476 family zinc finger protein n=1 Tax=Halosegnis marinus TaxID=3034023 RepID=A0ABD5ZPU8_9EURY|nr:HVO_0476 family zinc finger protein [Halosegnis sp. DT85]
MSQSRVAVACPSCSPDAPTAHEVLKQADPATVRCGECGHIHKESLPEEETVARRTVVSQDGDSFAVQYERDPGEQVEVGDEFLLDTPEALMQVRVTAIETDEGRRGRVPFEEVETLWTRAVENVVVDVTLHPKEGGREETRSLELRVPGDEQFMVDETAQYGDEKFTVEGLVIRDGVADYDRKQFDYTGDSALAKDLKRVYARDETSSAWSAW